MDEAHGVIKKLDEARFTLNRLLGPKGVLSERERQKYLTQRGEEEEPEDRGYADSGKYDATRQSRQNLQASKMVGNNNDYFYSGANDKGGEDEDFWYGGASGSKSL